MNLFKQVNFVQYFLNSLWVALIATVISIILGALGATVFTAAGILGEKPVFRALSVHLHLPAGAAAHSALRHLFQDRPHRHHLDFW